MRKTLTTPVILALIAALAALLVAWFVPLPRLVLSEEEKAAERMPQDRAAVEATRLAFEKAQASYKAYVSAHDVGSALSAFENAVQAFTNYDAVDPKRLALRIDMGNASAPVVDYLAQLQRYGQAGQDYFGALRHYDDELMAWTRSLSTESEALRPDTWPIVEYLKRYPIPIGENPDYSNISASDVQSLTTKLNTPLLIVEDDSRVKVLDAKLPQAIADVRTAGRSIEYIESLHPAYQQLLSDYDKKVQSVASNSGQTALSSSRLTFATGMNIILGAVTLAGLAALFLPRRSGKTEAPQ